MLIAVRRGTAYRRVKATSPSRRALVVEGSLVALVVAVFVVAGFSVASALWGSRVPLRYGGPRPSAEFTQWLALKIAIEQTVTSTLDVWLIIGLAVACAVALLVSLNRTTIRSAVTLTVIALSAVVLSFGSLVSFLQFVLTSIAPSFPIGLGTQLLEIGVVAFLLFLAYGDRGSVPNIAPSDLNSDSLDPARG
jgi:hypothetical protein